MDITLHNKLRNNSWVTFHEDDHIQWPHHLIHENHSNPQLLNLDDQVNFKHELPDQNQEDIIQEQELDHHQQQQQVGEGEEELGPMKEMMFKIASMQPVDIDPATIRRPKRRNVRISDDPQSVAARHRRERISEKIRILQRLVPGGTKMDTASMLDEAIRYVKFLKRQIRLLQSSNSNHHQPPPFTTTITPPPPEDNHWVTTTPSTTTTTTQYDPNSTNSYYFGGNNNVDNNDNDFNHKLFNFGQD